MYDREADPRARDIHTRVKQGDLTLPLVPRENLLIYYRGHNYNHMVESRERGKIIPRGEQTNL
jgi:hypothetical protein